MLAERTEGWFDEAERKGMQRGLEQGLQTGEQQVLRRLLTRRFGPLPADINARIEQASREQVEAWLDRVIDASSLQAVFSTDRQ